MTPLTDIQREVLVAYAECGMTGSRVAEKLFVHPNSVVYNLDCAKKKTKLDPRNTFELIQLLQLIGATDYVEVVRCKDCVEQDKCPLYQTLGDCGYCSRGERKLNES